MWYVPTLKRQALMDVVFIRYAKIGQIILQLFVCHRNSFTSLLIYAGSSSSSSYVIRWLLCCILLPPTKKKLETFLSNL